MTGVESSIGVPPSGAQLETIKVTKANGDEVHREGVFPGGHESAGNTTTTALGSAETFTGTGELDPQADVMVSCQTDNTGTLFFDFSVDGTNWGVFPVSGFEVASGIHEFHVAVKGPRYFRVRLVNDSGAQSYLRLYTYFGTFRQGNSPINQSVGLDTDAIHVRPTDFQDEVSLGRRTGITAWGKFGHRSLLAAAGEETIWDTTGNYTPPVVASTMTIAYDGTGGGSTDGAGTTGALVLRIWHIDSLGVPTTLDHTLGTDGSDETVVTTLGINRAQVISAGTLDWNAAVITITATTGGAKLAVIPAVGGITQQAIYHVGSDHQALFKFLYIHMNKVAGGSATVQVKGYVYNRTLDVKAEIFRTTLDDTIHVSETLNPWVPFVVPATGVLYFTGNTTRDGSELVIRFSGNEYQNV